MSDQKKAYKISLDNGHSEEVTEQELAAIKARHKRGFPYTVEPLQVSKPADEPAKAPAKAKDADKVA